MVDNNLAGWDVAPDGTHFLVVEPYQPGSTPNPAASDQAQEQYIVVLNWFAEPRQRMAAR